MTNDEFVRFWPSVLSGQQQNRFKGARISSILTDGCSLVLNVAMKKFDLAHDCEPSHSNNVAEHGSRGERKSGKDLLPNLAAHEDAYELFGCDGGMDPIVDICHKSETGATTCTRLGNREYHHHSGTHKNNARLQRWKDGAVVGADPLTKVESSLPSLRGHLTLGSLVQALTEVGTQ